MIRVACLLALTCPGACAAGDSASAPGGSSSAPTNPCPGTSGLDDGVQWQYARPGDLAEATSMEGSAAVKVEDFSGDDGPFRLSVVARDTGTGPNEGQESQRTSSITVTCEPEGLVVQSESATFDGQDVTYLYAPPVLVVPADVADGSSWSASGRVATGNAGGTSEADYAVDFEARAVASFEVAAGIFEALVIEAAGGRPGATLDAFTGAYAAGTGHLQLWDLELVSTQR
jgi:hypothetical protein